MCMGTLVCNVLSLSLLMCICRVSNLIFRMYSHHRVLICLSFPQNRRDLNLSRVEAPSGLFIGSRVAWARRSCSQIGQSADRREDGHDSRQRSQRAISASVATAVALCGVTLVKALLLFLLKQYGEFQRRRMPFYLFSLSSSHLWPFMGEVGM